MVRSQLTRRTMLAIGGGACLPRFARAKMVAAPTPFIEGVSGKEKSSIAKLGEAFRSQFALPGVSLAMSYRGQLKLLACFGYADQENLKPVRPNHQFRIASVSKPITSVSILRLVEQRRLSLDDKVFAAGGHLAQYTNVVTNQEQRDRIKRVTVRHLLDHSAGGWSNQRGDAPMFAKAALGLSHDQLIRWTLQNRQLKSEPGTDFAYSNFGYCLLGRVIEAVTGLQYEPAVQQLVLARVGATATHIGGHQRNQRRPDEVIYYDKHDPYGRNMDVTRMDAHGGWISTPTDLVRFAQCVDGFATPPDILQATTIRTMNTPQRGHYALGWNVNKSNNWWHTGSFNGGSSILARIHDGHCWAVIANTRSYDENYRSALDKFPWQVKASVPEWGNHNLFAGS